MNGFLNKTALISGSSRGLGKAMAQSLIARGARVALGDIDVVEGERTAQALGDNCRFVRLDVISSDDWQNAVSLTREYFGPLDILINNAGIFSVGSIESQSIEDWAAVLSVSASGSFLGCKTGVAAMRDRGGAIVNVASIASFQGMPYSIAYAAAKGAVESLTRSVAVHCVEMEYPIRCNSLHPGPIDTPMVAAIPDQFQRARQLGHVHAERSHASHLRRAEPAAVADAAIFLASDEARWVNGAALAVDNSVSVMSIISGIPTGAKND